MKLKRLIAAAAVVSLSLAGCVTPMAHAETPPRGAVPGPALWQVRDADTTIYLFGTVHALPQGKEWFDGRIERAFTAADELVTEVDIRDQSASTAAMQRAAMLPEGTSLRDLMTPDNRQQFEAALVSLGLPVEALDRLEPWMASLTMSLLPLLQQGYQTESGVEMALSERAGTKQRDALETVAQQIDLFDGMPIDAQLTFLDKTVEAMPEAKTSLDAMVDEWIVGDADALATMLNAELDDPVLYQRLLTQRNANWAGWIERRLQQPGTVFIAVGAGHLAGKDSVQRQLRKRGVKVERVWQ
ncbi:MAG TPA: TraB/GumN family protein [Croceibacterium sp.]|nr:TraB/GumN family protein [Croceibacterium sp.]